MRRPPSIGFPRSWLLPVHGMHAIVQLSWVIGSCFWGCPGTGVAFSRGVVSCQRVLNVLGVLSSAAFPWGV